MFSSPKPKEHAIYWHYSVTVVVLYISIFFSKATVPIGTKTDKNIHWIWSYLREFNKHALWEGKWKMAFYPD